MRIGVVGSMQYTERMLQMKKELEELEHDVFITGFASSMIGKNAEEIEKLKIHQKNNQDAIREFWDLMQDGDAILVANFDKHGIKNYIGGNTFLEMGFAHVLNQKIFLLNPIPEMIYSTEIEAMKPIILHGDLKRIQ